MKTIVIGLGNPILGDDGVGWQIAQNLQPCFKQSPDLTIECLALGGISLMEELIGYERAILVDAMVTSQYPVGAVNYYALNDLPDPWRGHTGSTHDTSLQNAIKVGQLMGADLPEDIAIVTVEAQDVSEFSTELSPVVEAAIPEALKLIQDLLIKSMSLKTPEMGSSIN